MLFETVTRQEAADRVWALKDVTFELAAGTSLGVLGRNGAGKSTLLQLICGTLRPSAGSVRSFGRVAAMLELGAGFDPEFSGRENARTAAAIYGLGSREIEARLPHIERFAELGPYFDRPVSEFSSGMFARLAFAVCAHVDAEILVVDEILGVGDAAFQHKCQRFMRAFRKRGTLVFVSHDPSAVLSACDRALWLDGGELRADGPAAEVLREYTGAVMGVQRGAVPGLHRPASKEMSDVRLSDRNRVSVSAFNPSCASHGNGAATITDCFFSARNGDRLHEIRGGQRVTLHIRARFASTTESIIVGFIFRNAQGLTLFGDNTYYSYRAAPPTVNEGAEIDVQLGFTMPYLRRGTYTIAPSIVAGTQEHHVPVHWLEEAVVLSVAGEAVRHGRIGLTIERASVSRAAPAAE